MAAVEAEASTIPMPFMILSGTILLEWEEEWEWEWVIITGAGEADYLSPLAFQLAVSTIHSMILTGEAPGDLTDGDILILMPADTAMVSTMGIGEVTTGDLIIPERLWYMQIITLTEELLMAQERPVLLTV